MGESTVKFTARNYLGETFRSDDLASLALRTVQAFDRDHGFTVTGPDGRAVAEITSAGVVRVAPGLSLASAGPS